MTILVRFAPSPTGYIHIGNLRTALFNWLFAKRGGGRFVLRFDDTDAERSRTEYAEAVTEDLAWIGVAPDVTLRQSDRVGLYDTSADRLRDRGLLYPCYETPDELDRRRKRLMGRGLPPVYGREALKLTSDDRARLEAEGRRPHWRFLLPNFEGDPLVPRRTLVEWEDLVRGSQSVDLASLSDPVLVREDGSYLYTLPSVVDDGEMGISHVIRGDDHVTNTGVQIALFEALGFVPPRFGHHNLLTTVSGEGLSKRSGALSLRTLREEGHEPMAVASLAVEVGMAGSIDALASLDALAERLDLSAVSQSAAKFDPAELDRLSAELVHAKPYAEVAKILRGFGVPEAEGAAFWRAVSGNCARLSDAGGWARIVYDGPAASPTLTEDDLAFVRAAFDRLPAEPFGVDTWKAWTSEAKAASGRKGRALFMPLRLALTGLDHGPEMSELLPLIGRDRTLARRP